MPLGFFVSLLPEPREQDSKAPAKYCRGFLLGGKMKNIQDLEKNQRVVTFLTRDEVDFLDKLGKDALFSTGFKLSRAKLIAWLIDFSKALNFNGKDIKSENDFENRLKTVFRQSLKTQVPPATPR
jgi:hypothetical protein